MLSIYLVAAWAVRSWCEDRVHGVGGAVPGRGFAGRFGVDGRALMGVVLPAAQPRSAAPVHRPGRTRPAHAERLEWNRPRLEARQPDVGCAGLWVFAWRGDALVRADAELESVADGLREASGIGEVDLEPTPAGADGRRQGHLRRADEAKEGGVRVVAVDVDNGETAWPADDAEVVVPSPVRPLPAASSGTSGWGLLPRLGLRLLALGVDQCPAERRVAVRRLDDAAARSALTRTPRKDRRARLPTRRRRRSARRSRPRCRTPPCSARR